MTKSPWEAIGSEADPDVVKTVLEVEDRRRRDEWVREFLSEIPIQELTQAVAAQFQAGGEVTPVSDQKSEDTVVLTREEYEKLLGHSGDTSEPIDGGHFSIDEAVEEIEEEPDEEIEGEIEEEPDEIEEEIEGEIEQEPDPGMREEPQEGEVEA